MRTGISITITRSVRGRLEAIAADRNARRSTSGGRGSSSRAPMVSARSRSCAGPARPRPASGAGRRAYLEAGVDGLLRDKTRPSRIPPAGGRAGRAGGRRTLAPPPGEATHWTVRAMAGRVGISPASVQRIWVAHGLQPHRVRHLQALQRPGLRRQAARRGRALCRPAGARRGALGRREDRRSRRLTAPSRACR